MIKARENARGSQDKITKEPLGTHQFHLPFHEWPWFTQKLETYDALSIITRLNKDLLLYNGILHVTMPRGLGWCFSSIGKHIERCLQTISLTPSLLQSYWIRFRWWRRFIILETTTAILVGLWIVSKSYSNIPHNRKVIQQVVFNREFAHSLIYTLELIDTYLNFLFKDNNLPEARTLQNQFGRLKSYIEYTDYHYLTNKELENLLTNTKQQLIQFSTDFSKLFFSYT